MPLIASAQGIRFKQLTINDGLSQNAIYAITQDADGFMWFGSKDGLNKYNGYTFKVYYHNPEITSSISANYITALYSDSKHNLWVGAKDGVVNRYVKSMDGFQQIYLPIQSTNEINKSEIKSILEDSYGNLWVGTSEEGVFKIPIKNNVVYQNGIKQYKTEEKNGERSLTNNISSIYEYPNGTLWISSRSGLLKMNIITENKAFYTFNLKHKDAPTSTVDFAITKMVKAGKGFLWLGSASGLVKFNIKDASYKLYPHHFNIFRYGWGIITEMALDEHQNLWLTTPAELMYFNTKTKKYISYKNDPLDNESISYNGVSSLFIAKSNIVWIGTAGMGINYYDPKEQRFSVFRRKNSTNYRISGFSIESILEENKQYLWISSEVLYRWDRKNNILKSFETSSDNLNAFGNTRTWSMIKSKDENLWFVSTEGLFVYNPKTETSKQFRYNSSKPNGLPQRDIFTVFEDESGDLWIASMNFLSKMIDRENGIFKHYRYLKKESSNQIVRPVLYNYDQSKIWLGTNDGLLLFDKEKGSFKKYQNIPGNAKSIVNNNIKSICSDPINPERYVWIGTSGGLELFDKKDELFTHFSEIDGLPNNVIYGILSDIEQNLWISTNKGIAKFNPVIKKSRNYDINDGLQSNEFNTGAFFKSPSGELFFGGIKGLNYFFPEKIKDNNYIAPVVLTNLKVYNRKDRNENSTFKERSIVENKPLTFNHNDAIITFEFAMLDFSAPQKNQYAYKLEDIHTHWIYAGYNRTATFTNLRPGNYNLKIKASNNDGIWNETGITIPIEVIPHWSGTWWAYTGYFMLFLTLLFLIRRYELKRFFIKNQLKIKRIELETLKSIDHLKSQFFTNISHEFRTPLTVISGQAENLMSELKSTKSRDRVKSISNSSKLLLKLINDLLDLSKLEAGKLELKTTQNNIVVFLKNIFYSFESQAQKKKISLSFLAEECDIQAVYDVEKVEKICYILLNNALKFTPDKGTVSLKVERKDQELQISISDTGIGIPENVIPLIFNRFFQVDNSDIRMFEGMGIGLAMAKELIELHGGSIQVYRNEVISGEKGTTFTFNLPIGMVSESHINDETLVTINNKKEDEIVTKNPLVSTVALSDKKIILLAEDNEDIRYFVSLQLQNTYQVIEAVDGDDGIKKAFEFIPDLILTDVMMPKIDGFKLVKTLRNDEKTNHIPIIMLTGKAYQKDKLEGLETGVDAFMTKPFNVKELQIQISNLIAQREQLRKKYSNTFAITSDEIPMDSMDQQFLEKTLQVIKDNINNASFCVDLLADSMCLSASQLHRKLIGIIDQAPGELIRNIRLQKASELIRNNAGTISDVCFQTGFNDQAYFSRAFKNQFGCSPSAYRKENR